MKGFRCNNCGRYEAGEPLITPVEMTEDTFGEAAVCPNCGSNDIDIDELAREDEDKSNRPASRCQGEGVA